MVALMRAGADSDNLVTAQLGRVEVAAFLFLKPFLVFGGRWGRRISWFQLGVAGFSSSVDRLSADRLV